MPRGHDDDFDPEDYGWSPEEWEELLDVYGYDSDEALLDAYPELEDFVDFMEELDYLDEIDQLDDDDDFYS